MNVKYLYDETKSPVGMVSVSQLQSFLSCKKKWEYGYIEEITPRVDRAYLTIGKLCHKGMQTAMVCAWEDQQDNPGADFKSTGRWKGWLVRGVESMWEMFDQYMLTTPLLDEEVPDMNTMINDAIEVFSQAFEEFEPWRYEVLTYYKKKDPYPALELHFRVPCAPTRGLHGYIDAILRDTETGFVWCTDYKFRKSLSPAEDESSNIQNAVYAYACEKLGINITGTMTWQHLNTPAVEPTVLKNGTVSRAKIKTTWNKYAKFCVELGENPESYREEMQNKLSDIEWYRATLEYRNKETINRIWSECVLPVARQVKAARGIKANNYRSLYPWNCKMCQYWSLCQAELRDYDADYIRAHDYTKRSHSKEGNKPIDESIATVV